MLFRVSSWKENQLTPSTNPLETDEELIVRVAQGDIRAFELLVTRYQKQALRAAQRFVYNRQEAEDMLQEGFMRVFTDLKDYRGEGSLEGWIRRVVIRAALRGLRQRPGFDLYETLPDGPATEPDEMPEPFPTDAGSRQVIQLLQQLPAGYRTVLNLFAIEGYSHEEIADMLGIQPATSRSQLSKARALLKQLLAREKILMHDQ